MDNRIDGISSTKNFSTDLEPPGGSNIGEFRGLKVAAQADATSLVADSAEELTFSAGEKVEKKLSERKLRLTRSRYITAKDRAEFYVRQLSDLGGQRKLDQLLDSLRRVGNPASETIRQILDKAFSDVSHRWAALDYTRTILRETGENPELLDSVNRLAEEYQETFGPEIRAGLNIGESVTRFSDFGLSGTQELRDSYRNTVLKYEGFHETYFSLVNHYGLERLPQAVDFLIEAVGNDLASQGPSIAAPALQLILNDLYQVEVLGNIHRNCRSLLERMTIRFDTDIGISAHRLMDLILALKSDNWPKPEQVNAIVTESGIKGIEAQICFTRELKELVADIPFKVYGDIRKRDQVLDTLQTVQDQLIAREEQETS